jgi:hypothetical protein
MRCGRSAARARHCRSAGREERNRSRAAKQFNILPARRNKIMVTRIDSKREDQEKIGGKVGDLARETGHN